MIRDRQREHARVAQRHPDAHTRAAAAYAWLERRGDPLTVPAVRAVASIDAKAARDVFALAVAHGAGHVRAIALRGSYELNPGNLNVEVLT